MISTIFKISLFLFIVVSCSTKEKKEPKKMEDIVPKSSSDKKIPSIKNNELDTVLIAYFADVKNLKVDSVIPIESKFLPDRFNPISSQKQTIYTGSDSTQFCFWKYKDSMDLKRSFYNFLDCIEQPCKSLKLLENKAISSSHIVIFKNDKNLIVIKSSQKINMQDWLDFFEKKKISNTFEIIIEQSKNRKTNWYKSTKDKINPLTK